MKRHDDPFFEMFREGLQGYEATPPAGAHAAIKQQMAKGSFFHFAWNRLNVYYAALLLGAGIAGAFVLNTNSEAVNGQTALVPHMNTELVLNSVQARLVNQHIDHVSQEDELIASKWETRTEVRNETRGATDMPTRKSDSGTPKADLENTDSNGAADLNDQSSAEASIVEPAMPVELIQPSIETQLPIDWMNHLKSPNLTSLLNQLDSDKETIHITLPVTVTVEK